MSVEEDPCKPQACQIQDCLNANNYDEAKCSKAIDNLYLCCKKWYEVNGTIESTTCCPKFSLLNIKLKQRGLGELDGDKIEHEAHKETPSSQSKATNV